MDTWDTQFPFTADEINLFSRLHQKATKFSSPSNIKPSRNHVDADSQNIQNDNIFEDDSDKQIKMINTEFLFHKSQYEACHQLSRDIDLLLEAHKQLQLASQEQEIPEKSESPKKLESTEFELASVQERIAHLEKLQQAYQVLATCSVPSVASSPIFTSSLRLLLQDQHSETILSPPLLHRTTCLMQKCWDNALVAMERVLDRDLTSIEAYLDDRVYKEMRDQVLKQLVNPTTLKPTLFQNLLEHFTSSYAQLRGNFIKFIIDTRLNSQFASSPPLDQILHLIERTRLLMSVERREFSEIFFEIQASPDLNKILETVGNLLFERIEQAAKHLKPEESKEIAAFIHPLMNSILSENNQKDPFGLFLKLLTERFGFKPPITSMKIEIHESVDNPDDTQFNSTSTHDNTVYVQSHNIDVINV